MSAKKSIMMDKLYGEKVATTVYDRCQELGDNFNKLVQEYVYDIFWARPGLSLREKSLITIVSLAALNKVEQLQIHVKGFFHQGSTGEDIKSILSYMEKLGYVPSLNNILKNLSALIPASQEQTSSKEKALSVRDKALVDLSSHIALGDNHKTEICMSHLLKQETLSKEDLENVMLHQIVYCGFPCAMNGYAVLKNIDSGTDREMTP